jgi:hypothetical protein
MTLLQKIAKRKNEKYTTVLSRAEYYIQEALDSPTPVSFTTHRLNDQVCHFLPKVDVRKCGNVRNTLPSAFNLTCIVDYGEMHSSLKGVNMLIKDKKRSIGEKFLCANMSPDDLESS